jgi:hypothetical protein
MTDKKEIKWRIDFGTMERQTLHKYSKLPMHRKQLAHFLRRERIKAKVGVPPLPTLREWLRSNK